MFRFLWRLSGNAADADDLLQEAFLATWRSRDQFEGRGPVAGGNAAGWLMRTAFRLYLNARRASVRRTDRTGRMESLIPDVHDARAVDSNGSASHNGSALLLETKDALSFLLPRVEAALAALPDGPREAFLMFRFEGLPVREIAEITGCPVKTVETRIRRATQLLAEALRGLRQHLPTP